MDFVSFHRASNLLREAPRMAVMVGFDGSDREAVREYINDRINLFAIASATEREVTFVVDAIVRIRSHFSL